MRGRLMVAVATITLVVGACGSADDPSEGCSSEPVTTDSELVIEDVECGDGETAESGDTITVHYVGTLESGEQFDSSRDRGEPFPFRLGAGDVIPGWDEGLVGMQVGGVRRLTIPPDLAYGETGFPPDIPPNATLVFEVELLEVAEP